MPGHLLVLDVDSTLITAEVIELIADRAGTRELVAAVTESAMRGEIDFGESLRQRVATLAGVSASVFDDVVSEVTFTPGARTLVSTVQSHGWHVALVSGGFLEVVAPLAKQLNISLYRANRLEVIAGQLTGNTLGPVIDAEAKATALREYATELHIPIEYTVAVGDGANDLKMMAAAGLGIAFNAKPIVRAQADIAIDTGRLDSVLDYLSL